MRIACAISVLLSAARVSAASETLALPEPARDFLKTHCVHCHGADSQEGHVRLDAESVDWSRGAAANDWERAFKKLSRGEMPPQSEPQPSSAEREPFLKWLEGELHEASLARQQREGRVLLRRLTRVEYENTLQDLLDAPIAVRSLLPEDEVVAGFDKVSAALQISAEHLLRYQEAAEAALLSAVPAKSPALRMTKDRRTGKQISEKQPHFAEVALGKGARLDGDTLLLYARPRSYTPCATAPVRQQGHYKVRIRVSAINTHGKPLPVMFVCRDQYGRDDTDVRLIRDIRADVPTTFEEEFELQDRQMIVFSPWTLPAFHEFIKVHDKGLPDDYAGPGLAIEWVEIEGPIDSWPPPAQEQLFGQTQRSARDDAERLMKDFLAAAFRRPIDPETERYFVDLVQEWLPMVSFHEAMRIGYRAALCSPWFLYLYEKPGKLDDHAVASRLSYFLWNSAPDDELRAVAKSGTLTQPEVLRAQVERMLNAPQIEQFVWNFTGQWLDLGKIDDTAPDNRLYAEFDEFLLWSMPLETTRFFDEMLRHDLSISNFVHSDWTFLNERLAQHYGIPDVHGGELRKVRLPKDAHRGGVLTHASVLKVTADGTRTSPVLRGKWVLERILGMPPAPPPPDIPSIEPDIRGAATIRQQLDKHRTIPSCNSCHAQIDPPGFALESFDAIGGWRDFYRTPKGTRDNQVELANYPGRKVFRGPPVELGGTLQDSRKFENLDEYKALLLANPEHLARNVAQQLIVYATGAEIQFADREVVEQIVNRAKERDYGLRTLVHEVVESRIFLNK